MKKMSLLMAALCAGVVFGAEFPDFAKAETWKEATWTKSNYKAADGVMTIERTADQGNGSGAWNSVAFPVKGGDVISGTVDVRYVSQEGKGCVRLGVDCVEAKGKRIKFLEGFRIYKVNKDFETRKFSIKVPEGAVQANIYLCIDGLGKVEYKNVLVK